MLRVGGWVPWAAVGRRAQRQGRQGDQRWLISMGGGHYCRGRPLRHLPGAPPTPTHARTQVSGSMGSYKPAELARMLWGFAAAGVEDPAFVKALAKVRRASWVQSRAYFPSPRAGLLNPGCKPLREAHAV